MVRGEHGSRLGEIFFEPVDGMTAERNDSLLVALADDAQLAVIQVGRVDLHGKQLADAQAGT